MLAAMYDCQRMYQRLVEMADNQCGDIRSYFDIYRASTSVNIFTWLRPSEARAARANMSFGWKEFQENGHHLQVSGCRHENSRRTTGGAATMMCVGPEMRLHATRVLPSITLKLERKMRIHGLGPLF